MFSFIGLFLGTSIILFIIYGILTDRNGAKYDSLDYSLIVGLLFFAGYIFWGALR